MIKDEIINQKCKNDDFDLISFQFPKIRNKIVTENLGELYHLFGKIYVASLFNKTNNDLIEKFHYKLKDLLTPWEKYVSSHFENNDEYAEEGKRLLLLSKREGEIDLIIKNIPKAEIIKVVKKKIGFLSQDISNLTDNIDLICEIKANTANNFGKAQWIKYAELINYFNKYDEKEVNSYFHTTLHNSKLMTLITNGYLYDFLRCLEKKNFFEDPSGNQTETSKFSQCAICKINPYSDSSSKKNENITPIIKIYKKEKIPLFILYIPQIYLEEYFNEFNVINKEKKESLEKEIQKLKKENLSLKSQMDLILQRLDTLEKRK